MCFLSIYVGLEEKPNMTVDTMCAVAFDLFINAPSKLPED